MRDYALSQSRNRDAAGASWFSRLVRNWQARRAIRHLTDCDDYMLADIGVQRLDVMGRGSAAVGQRSLSVGGTLVPPAPQDAAHLSVGFIPHSAEASRCRRNRALNSKK